MVSCFYGSNCPGIYEREQRMNPFDLSTTSCEGKILPAARFIDGTELKVYMHGCSSILDYSTSELMEKKRCLIILTTSTLDPFARPIFEPWSRTGINDMYNCSTIGCMRSFRSMRWLIEHEIKGNHEFAVKRKSMTDRAVDKFNELIETREVARIAVSEHLDTVGDYGKEYDYVKGWALKSSHTTHGLNSTAKKIAEEYFYAQRALNPPRRAEAGFMRTKLLNELDPVDPSGTKYLLDYSEVPTEKQLTSLFSRLERSRTQDPKKRMSKGGKTPKAATKGNRSRLPKTTGGNRKRRRESDTEEEEEDEDEEFEIEGFHEEDLIRMIIEENKGDIFCEKPPV